MPERLPFDPSRLRPSQPQHPGDGGPATLSVRQVNELISGVLASNLPPTLHVLGEVGNISQPASGHLYFTLKDAYSELRCVMWRSTARRMKFTPELGMAVIATGAVEVYTPRGTYQLIVRKMEPRGVGALEVAFRQLKERLEREGLFDAARKRPLPRMPLRVAIVTSPTGAVIRDILHTLERRLPLLDVLVFPVRVQGEGAAEEIAAAIQAMNKHSEALGGIDVAIVGRGGGSLEDLWAFNEEPVARAIAASRIPIVSAVGHEVDVSISDLVADLRAPTPTAAAELITPTLAELVEHLQRAARRADRAARHACELAAARLAATLAQPALARPLAPLREQQQLVDECHQRLRLALVELFRERRARLSALALALLRFGTGRRYGQMGRQLEQRIHRLARFLSARTIGSERRIARQEARLEKVNPARHLRRLEEHVDDRQRRLVAAAQSMLQHRRGVLDIKVQALNACAPAQLLKRGFSITREARTRRVVRSTTQIRDRTRIVVEVADGEFRATADDPRQPGLFEQDEP